LPSSFRERPLTSLIFVAFTAQNVLFLVQSHALIYSYNILHGSNFLLTLYAKTAFGGQQVNTYYELSTQKHPTSYLSTYTTTPHFGILKHEKDITSLVDPFEPPHWLSVFDYNMASPQRKQHQTSKRIKYFIYTNTVNYIDISTTLTQEVYNNDPLICYNVSEEMHKIHQHYNNVVIQLPTYY
jgi:hypothetical protein